MNCQILGSFLADVVRNPKVGFLRVLDILAHGTKTSQLQKQWRIAREEILSWSNENCARYKEEIYYLRDNMEYCMLPYDYSSPINCTIIAQRDIESNDLFVLHNGKRLYFPREFTNHMAEENYQNLVASEGILGSGKRRESPHSYVNNRHYVEHGDVVLDIGCAEGLFALDNAEKAGHIYLFEPEERWQRPLQATFNPYANKTTIISKLVSSHNSETSMRLEDAVKLDGDEVCFVKMDIEGYEREVLKDSKDFFTSHKVKLSCCLYHNQEDEEVIVGMLKEWGYKISLSDGYMLPLVGDLKPPYFRRGMVYARNF